ncbi:hypothetical protein N7465_001323 [Penicillium sp. CMV-2018d]|nr:hypothetical protein N7465_001323 [Penicillium sp. CMV-2018d]
MGRPGRQRDQGGRVETLRGGAGGLRGRKDSTRKQPSQVSLPLFPFIVNSDWTDSCQFWENSKVTGKKNHSYTLKSKMNRGTALLPLPLGYNENQAYHAVK